MRYALIGYGRMGRAIEEQARRREHELAAVVDPDVRVSHGRSRIDDVAPRGAQVAFEFTRPDQAEANVGAIVERGVPVVCGTTGW